MQRVNIEGLYPETETRRMCGLVVQVQGRRWRSLNGRRALKTVKISVWYDTWRGLERSYDVWWCRHLVYIRE